jgi:hypothetical protein
VNAWAFGTAVLITLIVVAGVLLDRVADRGHEIRWHDRFYQPQLPVRRGRVIDVQTRNTPRPGDRGVKAADLPAPRYRPDYVK